MSVLSIYKEVKWVETYYMHWIPKQRTWVARCEKDKWGCVCISWVDDENAEDWRWQSVWIDTINEEKHIYKDGNCCDLVSKCLERLGGKRMKSTSYICDWGDGDQDKFTNDYWDLSEIFAKYC